MNADFISYEMLKMIHIFSAFLLFGTGLGTAFFGLMGSFRGNAYEAAFIYRHVVLADWFFTTPAVIIQPLSGWLLMAQLGIEFNEPWIILTFILFAFTGMCWLPVVWLQIKMRNMALVATRESKDGKAELPPFFYRYARLWFILGWPAFLSVILMVWLMITKPELAFLAGWLF